MGVAWILITWLGASVMTFMVLNRTTTWKVGWLTATSAMVPPIGVAAYVVATGLLPQVSPMFTFLVSGTAVTVILMLLLTALGMRTRSWLQLGAVIAVLFVASFGPFLVMVRIASKAIRPGW